MKSEYNKEYITMQSEVINLLYSMNPGLYADRNEAAIHYIDTLAETWRVEWEVEDSDPATFLDTFVERHILANYRKNL